MKTIHLVYPHGQKISAPDSIGRNLGERLTRLGFTVHYYDWNEHGSIQPGSDDVLIGHAHPEPNTIFRNSCKHTGWSRILLMEPYAHKLIRYIAFIEPLIYNCDLFLAITGNYWYDTIGQSRVAHWLPKMIHLDLAVDRNDFPRIKRQFNPPGKRKFVYIGHNDSLSKNTQYLSKIARLRPHMEIGWIGSNDKPIRNLVPLGFQDFSSDSAKQLVQDYDFLLTVGSSDANPTTILEAMAWGLIPVCTPQSGYYKHTGIVNLPIDNDQKAAAILQRLQETPESELEDLRTANDQALITHYNWDRFVLQVVNAIESDADPAIQKPKWTKRAYLFLSEYCFLWEFSVMNRTRRLLNKIRKAWKKQFIPRG